MTRPPSLLSEVEFASFLVYSPRGTSEVSRTSRAIRDVVKNDRAGRIGQIAERLAKTLAGTGLEAFLGLDVTLVPVPGHAPLLPHGLWVARRICEELVRHGLGGSVLPCLVRETPVEKAAFAGPGKRPKVQDHVDSLRIETPVIAPGRITLVDDFVTKGSTLLAGATLLTEAFPRSEVKAFAVIRMR